MPELPEVETIRRQLAPRVTGRRVSAAWAFPHPKFDEALLTIGATVTGVGRRGKYLIAPLDDGRELIMHLGMTGAMGFVDEPLDGGDLAPSDPFVRARFRFDDDATLELHDVRRFGRVAVVEAGHYDRLPTLAALGPEPLSDDFTAEHLWRALARSRRAVKTQLLSQRVVAGVGNIYADEALWRAQVSPMSHRVGLERATGAAQRRPRRPRREPRARRHPPAQLPHGRGRHGRAPAPPRLLRPGRPPVRPLRHRAAAPRPRRARHHVVPHLPGTVRARRAAGNYRRPP